MTIRYGCQTFTWQMSYDRYSDSLPAILSTIREAGFRGVEAETCMLGSLYDPVMLKEELLRNGLELAALTLALPWREAEETADERREADRVMDLLARFPEASLVLVQLPGQNRDDLHERQTKLIELVNRIGERAHDRGIKAVYHPNSSPGSLFRVREDYEVLFLGLNERYVGYAPDSGHIAKGGMDVADIFRTARPLIRHVHFKDVSEEGEWRKMGEGAIAHPVLAKMLRNTGYDGWIMVEEESAEAVSDPDGVTRHNGSYVNRKLIVNE